MTRLRRNCPFIAVAPMLLVAATSTAHAKEDVSGYVAVQGEAKNKVSGGVDVLAELKYKTRRVEKTRAVISVEGSYYDRTLEFEDVYLDHKPNERLKWTLGISKKILGLEYEYDKLERTTIQRSPIYQKMERLGVVGRQLNLRLALTPESRRTGLELSGALGMDGSRDVNLQASMLRRWGGFGIGTWVLGEAHKVNSSYRPMLAEAVALWCEGAGSRATLELFQGIDTQKSEFYETFGGDRVTLFLGSKLEFLHDFRLGTKTTLSPMLQSSFWFDDTRDKSDNSLQFLLGVRLTYARLTLSINGETKGERRMDANQRHFNQGALYVEVLGVF